MIDNFDFFVYNKNRETALTVSLNNLINFFD